METSWANASVETLARLLTEHYEGKISIYDYMGVGDVRSVKLNNDVIINYVLTATGV